MRNRILCYCPSKQYPQGVGLVLPTFQFGSNISNNFAENAIRPFVVGRKNRLFSDTVKGAESSAIVYTLLETAKANGLNPHTYGREYGSGQCYLCTKCGAFVGTHKPRPREALGLLANARMRREKKLCHELFDPLWRGKPKAQKKRQALYFWLSKQLDIPWEDCHFGYFDLERLRKAYKILLEIQGQEMRYDNCGRIYCSLS